MKPDQQDKDVSVFVARMDFFLLPYNQENTTDCRFRFQKSSCDLFPQFCSLLP